MTNGIEPVGGMVELKSFPDSLVCLVGVEVFEAEPAPILGGFREVADRIAQAPDTSDDGDGTLSHGVHLVESAGFHSGGHEEKIGAGIELVCEAFVVFQDSFESAGVLGIEVSELVVEIGFPGA